ncbi:MAG: DUF72 domain-containing protein [Candidatus Aminicenantes bacterium]|nr:DUF72 domain-containing protein [Candidatus Aminicenantes bacterium]
MPDRTDARADSSLPSCAVPPALAPYLRIGTCSWKYPSWKGLIYDEGKAYRPDDYLADYSKRLNSVEVDQWFWSLFPGSVRLPEPHVVRLFAQSVPDDFIFTVKAPNALTLTHFYSKAARGTTAAAVAGKTNEHFLSQTLLETFLERLAPFGRKLGPIMFQFEYLNRQKMPSVAAFIEQFDAFITRAPKGFQYAIETRNPNYLSPTFFEFLARRGLGFVYLDGYYMPPIGQVFEKKRAQTASAGFEVLRLHGGDRLEIEKKTGDVWDRVIAPKPEGLRAAARIVRANVRKKVLTFVNVNNHYEGSAPMTIGRLLEALREKDED